MGRQPSEERDRKALAVAALRSQGKNQKQIEAMLNIPQPEVSRLLAYAQGEKHWLRPANPVLTCDDQRLLQEVHSTYLSYQKIVSNLQGRGLSPGRFLAGVSLPYQHLLDRLQRLAPADGAVLRNIAVFWCKDGRFDEAAARRVAELLRQTQVLGVTWGRTLKKFVQLLRRYLLHHRPALGPLRLVPLCGEPLKDRSNPLRYSSTHLAIQLNTLINGDASPPVPSLAGVPALIPSRFDDVQAQVIRQFLREVGGYTEIFGDPAGKRSPPLPPLVQQVDTILTSVGAAGGEQRGIFLQERISLKDFKEAELLRLVAGDIGGVLIPRQGLGDDERQKIQRMNAEKWTGVKQDDLERCAREALRNGRPGIVVLAIGAARREVVQRCVELNLVNELLVDQELAAELERDGR
jgi:DNA-binding transcriptional regulator LsrR (DeoR family)